MRLHVIMLRVKRRYINWHKYIILINFLFLLKLLLRSIKFYFFNKNSQTKYLLLVFLFKSSCNYFSVVLGSEPN